MLNMKAFGQQIPPEKSDDEQWKEWISGSLSERLSREADAEERRARQFEGCSFYGRWPGSFHLERASMMRQAAIALKTIGKVTTSKNMMYEH